MSSLAASYTNSPEAGYKPGSVSSHAHGWSKSSLGRYFVDQYDARVGVNLSGNCKVLSLH